jgi:hypothetical protein
MPIHFDDLDVVSQVTGLSSALIVPCNMCPAVSVAVKENKPCFQLFRSFLKSPPFEKYIKALQSQLREHGVKTTVFKSDLPHQFFMCMWPQGRRKKLLKHARKCDAVVVLGCESAIETARDSVKSADCKVIQGMETAGFMNAKLRFHLPCNISFGDCRVIPISQEKKEEDRSS